MDESRSATSPPVAAVNPRHAAAWAWAWFILKNVLGWLLILMSLVVGPALPGPGGIPLFLIGFALVSFPGKRGWTARVMRGTPFRRLPRWYSLSVLGISLVLPTVGAIMLLWMTRPRAWLAAHVANPDAVTLELYLSMALLLWLLLRVAPRGANLLLPWAPRMRRKIRPWLRERGIHLLPPRRRHRDQDGHIHYTDNILVLSDRFHHWLGHLWRQHRWWLLALAVAVAVAAGAGLIRLF